MRTIKDEHIQDDLTRLLNQDETLKCGVLATITADLKKTAITGEVFGDREGVVLPSQQCIVGISEERLLFSLLSSVDAEEMGTFSIELNQIEDLKIKKSLFGKATVSLDIKKSGNIKIHITNVEAESQVKKQKEMKDKLIEILEDISF